MIFVKKFKEFAFLLRENSIELEIKLSTDYITVCQCQSLRAD